MFIALVIVATLIAGVVLGLHYRGYIFIGDRRHLDVMAEQLRAEHRAGQTTAQAIAAMRAVVRDQLRRDAARPE